MRPYPGMWSAKASTVSICGFVLIQYFGLDATETSCDETSATKRWRKTGIIICGSRKLNVEAWGIIFLKAVACVSAMAVFTALRWYYMPL